MTKSDLRKKLLSIPELNGNADVIAETAHECVHAESRSVGDESEIPIGSSKLGGRPDLPAGVEWPIAPRGFPLIFLAQFKLRDLPQLENENPLPQSGLLSVFYDADEQPWGFDPKDAGSWKVIYTPEEDELVRREFPDGFSPDSEFSTCQLTLAPHISLPSWERSATQRLNLNEVQLNAYDELLSTLRSGFHQLLGLPFAIQGDSMELECQLASNGLYCGNSTGYEDARVQTLRQGTDDWRLLLQLDSDDNAEMMWGDGGILYFWIREQDLAANDFSGIWCILQCY